MWSPIEGLSGLGSGPLGSLVVGPVQFDRERWLLLLPVLVGVTWLIGRKSLSGLGGPTKWTALIVRVLVLALVVGALARPQRRDVAENVAVIAILDESRSIPPDQKVAIEKYIADASEATRLTRDELGTVTAAEQAYVQSLPSALHAGVIKQFIGSTEGTNLGEGARLGLAMVSEDAATRLLLITDGNETAGSLLRAAEAAKAVGIPIDVLMVEYQHDEEVIIDELVAPSTVRAGETIQLRVVMNATRPVIGRLRINESGTPIDLDPSAPGFGVEITLDGGRDVRTVSVQPVRPGPQSYEAFFEPIAALGPGGERLAARGDSIPENNQAGGVTFVGSEGWVLLVSETPEERAQLEQALIESDIRVVTVSSASFPSTLTELNAYEAVILVNEPSHLFSEGQQEMMRQYIHDNGGGLVMVGGPDSFGAGGWIGSPLADALPIRLDPPQKRQMPRGALALIVHSVEIPQGVYHGKQVCIAAVKNLSSQDLVGIIEYSGIGGTDWVLPLQQVSNMAAAQKAINSLTFGDMPSFDPSLRLALQGLRAANAGQKHCIVISDGDPSLSMNLVRQFKAAGITISAVGVNPHSAGDLATLRNMATTTGGNYYEVKTNALATLPDIFVKEAQTIRRSLIWEGEPFSPAIVNIAAEPMRGITGVPPISGYVVASDREGLSLVTMRGKENDPVGAIWQHGLGKVVTYTSDATTRWGASWVGWDSYKQFWEQHVRWAMRPGGSATIRVNTENRGDETLLVIEAIDSEGERLNFAQFNSRVARPDGTGQDIEVLPVGPGRYEAVIDTADPGSYVLNLGYRARDANGEVIEGSAQAAITRAFADEFRALQSNRALLQQVADMTGGRMLAGDPETDDLWAKAGLTMPIGLTPFWLTAAIVGIAVFLIDVGVRRVRVNPAAIAETFRRGFGQSAKRDTEQLGSLKAARSRARDRMGGVTEEQKKAAQQRRSVKFEVSDDALPTDPGSILSVNAPATPTKKTDDEGTDSLSALKRAKRRAQEDREGS